MAEGLIKGVAATVHSVTEENNHRLQIKGGKDFVKEIDRLFAKLGYGQHRCLNCGHKEVCHYYDEVDRLQRNPHYGNNILLQVSSCKWCEPIKE